MGWLCQLQVVCVCFLPTKTVLTTLHTYSYMYITYVWATKNAVWYCIVQVSMSTCLQAWLGLMKECKYQHLCYPPLQFITLVGQARPLSLFLFLSLSLPWGNRPSSYKICLSQNHLGMGHQHQEPLCVPHQWSSKRLRQMSHIGRSA